MWMLTNGLHHTEEMHEFSLDLEMHELSENPVRRQIHDGQRLFICGGRYADCWYSEFYVWFNTLHTSDAAAAYFLSR